MAQRGGWLMGGFDDFKHTQTTPAAKVIGAPNIILARELARLAATAHQAAVAAVWADYLNAEFARLVLVTVFQRHLKNPHRCGR